MPPLVVKQVYSAPPGLSYVDMMEMLFSDWKVLDDEVRQDLAKAYLTQTPERNEPPDEWLLQVYNYIYNWGRKPGRFPYAEIDF